MKNSIRSYTRRIAKKILALTENQPVEPGLPSVQAPHEPVTPELDLDHFTVEKITPNIYLKNLPDQLWLNLLLRPEDLTIPALPSEEIQTRFTGVSNLATLKPAFAFYKIILAASKQFSNPISSMDAILDFGCGWGRIIRLFMRDLDPTKLFGIDCVPEMISLCKETNPWVNFSCNEPLPPAQFEDNSFNLIYAYSVFSHLSEESAALWIQEFHRILKPGGLIVLTARKRDFIQNMANPPYPAGLNIERGFAEYDAGKYVYYGTGGGFNLTTDFYGEAFIPKQYVENKWSDLFNLTNFNETAPYVDQNVIIAVRK